MRKPSTIEKSSRVITERVKSVDAFVRKMAAMYASYMVPGIAIDVDDLVNIGRMGAMRAAQKFDPERGVKFLSYAGNWIRAFILREIDEKSRTIKLPLGKKRKKNLQLDTERDANVAIRREVSGGVVSIDASDIADDGMHSTLAASAPSPEDLISKRQESEVVADLLMKLNERERLIVRYRFVEEMTLDEAGERLGLSRERVRQLEVKAIKKLRLVVGTTGIRR